MSHMRVTALPTRLVKPGDDLFDVLEEGILEFPEESVLVITSKIISICEGRLVPKGMDTDKSQKHDLVRGESQMYLDPEVSKYDVMLTVNNSQLFINAGIDESNVEDAYVMWPSNLQEWANEIWQFIRDTYDVEHAGVIISDSRSTPLQWGVTGASLAHAGFFALNSKIGHPDLFGRDMKMVQVNVAQALAVAGVLEMGETNEQSPLAVIEDVREIVYQDRVPTLKELEDLRIALQDDVYAPLLTSVDWREGGRKQ
jgi:F420-0:gamma-glutamyl ligase